jgi:hypothetical protein
MKNPKIFGAVLLIVGFAILILNAADYLGGFFGWSWEIHLPSSGVGVVFIVVGMMYLSWLSGAHKPEPDKSKKT